MEKVVEKCLEIIVFVLIVILMMLVFLVFVFDLNFGFFVVGFIFIGIVVFIGGICVKCLLRVDCEG